MVQYGGRGRWPSFGVARMSSRCCRYCSCVCGSRIFVMVVHMSLASCVHAHVVELERRWSDILKYDMGTILVCLVCSGE